MGWDVKASAVAAGDALPSADQLKALLPTATQLTPLVFAAMAAATLYVFSRSKIGRRIGAVLEETMFANWQLALLGTTGIVLSLASGYTTWDGMRNFTGEAVLSLMVTFGIQGVMLIVAWLIGESFAVGMNRRVRRSAARGDGAAVLSGIDLGRLTPFVSAAIGILLFLSMALLLMQWSGSFDLKDPALSQRSWVSFADKLLFAAAALLFIAIIALNAGSDLVDPYLQSARVMIRNAVLWVMFLSCMGTSVFFSFDSLFTAIFPQSERVRAAELRAQNQVAGIIADIGSTISTRRLSEAERLFDSAGWRAYDDQLAGLAKAAQGSADDIEKYFNDRLEERNRAVKQQQERIVTAQTGQAGLQAKKTQITEELARLKGERPALAADYAEKKSALDARAKEIDAKRVEAMAEDRGVEGSGKSGKGPQYRARMDELAKLTDYYKIGEERVKDAAKRLNAVDTRIAQIERELAAIDGDLAKFKGETATAEQRIRMAQESQSSDAAPRIDPSRVLPVFETARAEFRQSPEVERLSKVQQYCAQIYGAMATATPETKRKVANIDCDPKQAAEAASVVFALNDGLGAFARNCAGGDKLSAHVGADALFGFARKCLADSGLPSRDTDALRSKINAIELARDDKAHRFVVTWNAFSDGNRLAYLALGLAIAIDGLVFMSGLFGANAVRSPLSDISSYKARSAAQLESIIDQALLPHTFETAQLVLNALRPITEQDGFTSRVVLDPGDPHAREIGRVLSSAATIGAVRQGTRASEYEVRAELVEYLASVAKKAFKADRSHATLADLERTLQVALLPDVAHGAETVLGYMHPVENEKHGFTNEIDFAQVIDDGHRRIVRNALNAGATLQKIQRASDTHYYIHGDYYKTLVRIRARLMSSAAMLPPGRANPAMIDGGRLNPAMERVARDEPRQITSVRRQPEEAPARGDLRQEQPVRSGVPFSKDEAQELYNTFVTRMLTDAELEPMQLRLISERALWDPAMAAAKALDSLQDSGSRLGAEVLRREQQILRTIERSFDAARSEFAREPDVVDVLGQAHRDVIGAVPALMLCQGGPFEQIVNRMIEEIERAAGPDDGLRREDEELVRRLRGLRAALKSLDRRTAESWRDLSSAVSDYDETPNVVPMPRPVVVKH